MDAELFARRFALFFACVWVILAFAVPESIHGQLLQGSLTGNVTDTSNAAIPDAKVNAREQRTNFTRDTTTNNAGVYSLPTMPPGTYTITVTAPSLQTVTVTGVVVSPEEVTRRDVVLSVSQVNQIVEVQAEAVGLQTDRADIRDDVSSNLLQNAPVPIGRNYQMPFLTLPGVSPPTNANSFTANASRGLTFVVNGGDAGYNDGIDIEARAPGNPTKDRMRFMIQSLLVDRFKLVTHTERRTKPVFTLLLAKPEKIGPQLQKHLDDGSCFVEARPGTSGAVPPIAIVEPSAWVSASAILFMVALLRPTTTDPLLKLLSACREFQSLGLLFKYLR